MLNRLTGYRSLSRLNKFILLLGMLCCISLLLSYLATHIDPNSAAWLAFFGLAYPILLFLNLLFLLYWTLKKHRQFWWFAIAILIGFGHHCRFVQVSTHSDATDESIKVMSYNVRLFDLYNWTENWQTKNQILGLIAEEDPDILCLQEFYKDEEGPEFRMTDTLCSLLGTEFYH